MKVLMSSLELDTIAIRQLTKRVFGSCGCDVFVLLNLPLVFFKQ